jgi:hypothetical protein
MGGLNMVPMGNPFSDKAKHVCLPLFHFVEIIVNMGPEIWRAQRPKDAQGRVYSSSQAFVRRCTSGLRKPKFWTVHNIQNLNDDMFSEYLAE